MTTPDFDALAAQIEKDRAEGTPGPWSTICSGATKIWTIISAGVPIVRFYTRFFLQSDVRRIARVPDLEAAFLACYAALQAAQAETQRAVGVGKHE